MICGPPAERVAYCVSGTCLLETNPVCVVDVIEIRPLPQPVSTLSWCRP